MTERRVLLDAAAFMDSAKADTLDHKTAGIRAVVQRFLEACYADLGKAPRFLDGGDLEQLLKEVLPRRFGVRDPLATLAEDVLAAYLAFLQETEVVPAAFEQRQALHAHAEAFRSAVARGAAHRDGIAVTGKGKTVVHRGDRVGRNDPCPCGSGRKYKKCCLPLGEA
ncbi:MAG: SEC-C metal-binding domain-containing protein [Planctomycetota bacterium]